MSTLITLKELFFFQESTSLNTILPKKTYYHVLGLKKMHKKQTFVEHVRK